jgi:hypothetical protein
MWQVPGVQSVASYWSLGKMPPSKGHSLSQIALPTGWMGERRSFGSSADLPGLGVAFDFAQNKVEIGNSG